MASDRDILRRNSKIAALAEAISMQRTFMGRRFVFVSDLEKLQTKYAKGER